MPASTKPVARSWLFVQLPSNRLTVRFPNRHVSESHSSASPSYSLQQQLIKLFNFATKWILTNCVYKHTKTLVNSTVFHLTLGVNIRANVEKPLMALFCIQSLPAKFIRYLHIILCVCVFWCKISEWKRSYRNVCIAQNGIEWSWRVSVAAARTHGLRGCLKTISFEYQKEYHISVSW